MHRLLQDLRQAIRHLARSPGFTAVAVVVLALGIGANSALFGVLNALLLRPPAGLEGAERLVWVMGGGRFSEIAYPDYLELREATAYFSGIAAYQTTGLSLGSGEDPLSVTGQLVSGNYFDVLGATPVIGRGFAAEEDRTSGTHPVVVLGHRLWEARFDSDPRVVGRTVDLNGHPFTVVGVGPPGFIGTEIGTSSDLWVPTMAQPLAMPRDHDVLADRRFPRFSIIGRLADGASPERAEAALRGAALELNPLEPERVEPLRPEVTPLRGWLPISRLRNTFPAFSLAAVVTGLVLLIACANVANLLLARGIRRRREFGIRLAIGASRARLVRQLLVESVLLALVGGALGAWMAFWGAEAFNRRFFHPVTTLDVSPDLTTLAFTLVLALGTGVLFGMAPAWRASGPDVVEVIQGSRASPSRRSRLQSSLVIAQMALSLTLLVTAGLFLRKFQEVATVELGFDAEHILTLGFDLSTQGMQAADRDAFARELEERVRRIPGVREATMTSSPRSLHRALSADPGSPSSAATVATGASPEFFRTMGIPLLQGEGFGRVHDQADGPRVAVISRSLAQRLWPGADPIGRRLHLDERSGTPIQVIGIAGDARLAGHDEVDLHLVYRPEAQHYAMPASRLLVRTTDDPMDLVGDVRAEMRAIAPGLPVYEVTTLARELESQVGVYRRLAVVVAGFGMLALALAAIGLYGVMAFTVAARTREIGIRMALGAPRAQVLLLHLRDGARLMLVGAVIGSLLSLAIGRVVASAVEGIAPTDPLVLVSVTLLLMGVAIAASYLPSRRATRIDPVAALRAE